MWRTCYAIVLPVMVGLLAVLPGAIAPASTSDSPSPTPIASAEPTSLLLSAPAQEASAKISLQPATIDTWSSSHFEIRVQVDAGAGQLDRAWVYIDFDPQYLRVTEIIAVSSLPTVLESSYDNEKGTVDYRAEAPSPLSGTFDLVTITFFTRKATPSQEPTRLGFNTEAPRRTDVTFQGSSLLGSVSGAEITIKMPELLLPGVPYPAKPVTGTPDPRAAEIARHRYDHINDPTIDDISIQPASIDTWLSSHFEVRVQVDAGAGQVDRAWVYIDFDPQYLRVTEIIAGSSLPTVLESSYDNEKGTVDYRAEAPSPLSGTFDLVTITFFTRKATPSQEPTRLGFSTEAPRRTDVTFQGASVLGVVSGAEVTIKMPEPLLPGVPYPAKPVTGTPDPRAAELARHRYDVTQQQPKYSWLGAVTEEKLVGVFGSLEVTNPDVPHSPSPALYASRFLVKRADGSQWLEVGWAEVEWEADAQYIYTFDTVNGGWTFYEQFPIQPGDMVGVMILHFSGSTWAAWLQWNSNWELLKTVDLGFIEAEATEQFGEIVTDSYEDDFWVPDTHFDNVQVYPAGGSGWVPWDTSIQRHGNNDQQGNIYHVVWENKYYKWSLFTGIRGKVELQRDPWQRPPDPSWVVRLEVDLWNPGGYPGQPPLEIHEVYTDEEGWFDAHLSRASGVYDIGAKVPHSLRNLWRKVTLKGGEIRQDAQSLHFGRLLEGDTNGDDAVTGIDYSAVVMKFGQPQLDPYQIPMCDFNHDGWVTGTDYSAVIANFGLGMGLDAVASMSIQLPAIAGGGIPVGQEFDVIVQIDAGTQQVDTASAYIDFEPMYLEVRRITTGNSLPTVIENKYDNLAGTINYSAGTSSMPPSGTFDLVTICFYAKAATPPGEPTQLTFNFDFPRKTDTVSEAWSLLGPVYGAAITIE